MREDQKAAQVAAAKACEALARDANTHLGDFYDSNSTLVGATLAFVIALTRYADVYVDPNSNDRLDIELDIDVERLPPELRAAFSLDPPTLMGTGFRLQSAHCGAPSLCASTLPFTRRWISASSRACSASSTGSRANGTDGRGRRRK